jgi:predicted Zn-ribbon and HTH transcriptional regulator
MNRKFCPKCKSENVEIHWMPSIAYGEPQPWRCKDCGYEGVIFPEKVKTIKKLKKKI